MGKWSRNKVSSENLNSGNEYDKNSQVALQELNGMVNAGLYAQDFVEHLTDAPDTSEAGNVGTPKVEFIDNLNATTDTPYKMFKFSNLKGAGVKSVTQYYLVSSSSSGITTSTSGWTTTTQTVSTTKRYLWNYEVVSYTDGTTTTTTPVIIGVYGDTGTGISSVAKTGTSGLTDTYTITFTDGTTTTFSVKNGKGITTIAKTSSSGLTDTYTITYNDGTTSDFIVTNGNGIEKFEHKDTNVLTETYEITFTNGTKFTFDVTQGKGITTITKTGTNVLEDTYTITYNDETTSTFTIKNGRGISSLVKSGSNGLVDTYTITYNDNTTSTFAITNGDSIDMRIDNGYIQWKYSSNTSWVNLIALDDIIKIYDTTGQNTDGAMTQKATTDELATKPGLIVTDAGTGNIGEIFNDYTNNTASGSYSHAEGYSVTASGFGSHAEGYKTTASEFYSHAEGNMTTASGFISHAEGASANASGTYSHAEGAVTTASGDYSHAEGYNSKASGNTSHASGYYTTADQDYQTAVGAGNLTGHTGALFSVGNGTMNGTLNRSTAFEVFQDGHAELQGDLIANGIDINTELTNLADTDTTLQNNLDTAISTEASARASADTTLQTNIDTEASTRAKADTTLQNNIDNEASARKAADTTLQNNIDSEATTRANADTTLQTNINTEITNRTNADADLQSQIDNLDSVKANKTDVTNEINTAVSAVVDSAPEAFDTLKEIADWIAQDESGTEALVTRVSAIETKNTEQDTAISKAQSTADGAVSKNSEQDTRLTNIETKNTEQDTALTNETTARKNADTTLQTNINTEASSRAEADETLQSNIDAEASARQTADNTLTNSKLDNVTIASGSTNGTIKLTKTINTTSSTTDNIAVTGLKSAAYEESSTFATSAQGTLATNAVRSITSGTATTNGKVRLVVNTGGTSANVDTAVTGLSAVATSGNYNDLSNLPIIPDGAVLYDSTGENTNGAMTQKAVTDELISINSSLETTNSNVETLKSNLETTNSSVETLKTNLQTTNSNVADLTLNLAETESTAQANATRIEANTTRIEANEKDIEEIRSSIPCVDQELSETSTNAIANKVVAESLSNKLTFTTITGESAIDTLYDAGLYKVFPYGVMKETEFYYLLVVADDDEAFTQYKFCGVLEDAGSPRYASIQMRSITNKVWSSWTALMERPSSATAGDLAQFKSNGQVEDSGISAETINQLDTKLSGIKMDLLWTGSLGTNGSSISLNSDVTQYDFIVCCGEAWSNTGYTLIVGTTKTQPAYSGNYTSASHDGGQTGYGVKGTSFYASVRLDNSSNTITYYTGYDNTVSSNQAYLQRVYGISLRS